jgi:hypothetical protein
MVFGIIGILLLAGVLLGKISWGWAVLGAIFLYWDATWFWKKYKAASNAILARHTFNLLSELDRKEVLVAVSAIMSNAKYPSQDPEEELKSMTPEQRYGFIALGMARIGITPKLGGGWYEIHNPYAEILGAHREIAFVKHQIRLRYGVDVNFGDVVASTVQQSGLVPQDLPASQQSKQPALPKDNNELYRQARIELERRRGKMEFKWWEDINPSLSTAFKIFQKLAGEGYGKSYYPLSILYGGNFDIKEGQEYQDRQDRTQHFAQLAFNWCFANQVKQDVELWCDLGEMYHLGSGVEKNEEQAAYWFHKAAEEGDSRAQWWLGCLSRGNAEQTANWYRKAAEQGYSRAQWSLGEMYRLGRGVEENFERALYWLTKSAEQGDAEEQVWLGDMYSGSDGFEKNDENDEQAGYWYRKAAEQGDSTGQWKLGDMYREGRGVEQDDEQAAYWFRKAAEQQDDKGQLRLGDMYREGRGVEQNYKQAMHWYLKATESGHIGFRQLGDMYKEGLGVDKDVGEAKYWYGQEPHWNGYSG